MVPPRAGQGGDLGSAVAKLPREKLGGTCSRGAGGKGGGGWIWCGGWGVGGWQPRCRQQLTPGVFIRR